MMDLYNNIFSLGFVLFLGVNLLSPCPLDIIFPIMGIEVAGNLFRVYLLLNKPQSPGELPLLLLDTMPESLKGDVV